MNAVETPAIQKTPNVCSGDACIRNMRIQVWLIVLHIKLGQTTEQLLANYPTLTAADLDACWDYYHDNPVEVEQTLWRADIAANVPDGSPPPAWVLIAGGLVGLSDDDIRNEFDPPVPADTLVAAWREYRTDPARITRQITHYRMAG